MGIIENQTKGDKLNNYPAKNEFIVTENELKEMLVRCVAIGESCIICPLESRYGSGYLSTNFALIKEAR